PLHYLSFTPPPTTHLYTLSLHDALPISWIIAHSRTTTGSMSMAMTRSVWCTAGSRCHRPAISAKRRFMCTSVPPPRTPGLCRHRSEEHTSELQSRFDLVCRLLLEKKKYK